MDEMRLLRQTLSDVCAFARLSGVRLRPYQAQVARAIVDAVLHDRGLSFVVMFPRQSGKNEVQAHLEAYLLTLFSGTSAEMVKASPTLRPQSLTAMRRLERVLNANPLTRGRWRRESGNTFRLGQARIHFLSAAPGSSIVGATASLLLEVDEAQAVSIEKFDTELAPMTASTGAVRVFWGTAWTASTLLGRELRLAQAEQARDGVRRVFRLTAAEVIADHPRYARTVERAIQQLGRNHPAVRTQYFSEEVDAAGTLFPEERLALLRGSHPWQDAPLPGRTYAFLLDVGGTAPVQLPLMDEYAGNRRDSSALVIVEVEPPQDGRPAPRYRAVHLCQWTGVSQTRLFEQVLALARQWSPRRIVIDATGVGAGLADFLDRALPGRVVRFVFSSASKSDLGYRFLEVVESGRFHLPQADEGRAQALVERFLAQCRGCTYEVDASPHQRLRWGVPEGARHPGGGGYLHDDLLMAGALCALLDRMAWGWSGAVSAQAGIIPARDPLKELDGGQ